MSRFELISFANQQELAKAAATQWLREIEATASNSRAFLTALSGGRMAGHFFPAAAELARAQRDPLKNVHFFWSDERCVPPDDAESNFAAARELLLSPLGIAESQIHRIRGEDRPNRAAA